MSSFGITPEGFVQKTLPDILAEFEGRQRADINAGLNLTATSVFGQLNGIYGDAAAQVWEQLLAVYRAQSLDSAENEQLDNLATIVNASRLPAVKSSVTLRVSLDPGTSVVNGYLVSVGADGDTFRLIESVTNFLSRPDTIPVRAESVNFGPIQGLAGTINRIKSPVGGWTPNAAITTPLSGPYDTTAGKNILKLTIDGTNDFVVTLAQSAALSASDVATSITAVIPSTVATATAFGNFVRIRSANNGSVKISSVVVSNDATSTAATVLGFTSFDNSREIGMNRDDAVLGRLLEQDEEFRVRIRSLLRGIGKSTVNAILASVSSVPGVTDVVVFQNRTDTVSVQTETLPAGIPPHGVLVLVDDISASNDAIAKAIFESVAAGIETGGDVFVNVTDSSGVVHVMRFERVLRQYLRIALSVKRDTTAFKSDADARAKISQVLIDEANKLKAGQKAVYNRFRCAPFQIDGVTDISTFLWNKDAAPTLTTDIIPGDVKKRLSLRSSDINITFV